MPSLLFVEIIAYQGPYPVLGYKAQKNNLNFQFKRKAIHTLQPQFIFCLGGIFPSRGARECGTKRVENWFSGAAASGIPAWPEGKVSGVLARSHSEAERTWVQVPQSEVRWELAEVPI